jgi:hypothetical protein
MTNTQRETYEPPTFTIIGDLREVTKNGQKPNGDLPKMPDTAFGPDS